MRFKFCNEITKTSLGLTINQNMNINCVHEGAIKTTLKYINLQDAHIMVEVEKSEQRKAVYIAFNWGDNCT